MSTSIAITLAEYVRGLQRRRRRSARVVGRCRACDRGLDDLPIIHHGTGGCRHCIPMTRQCARCKDTKPLTAFDVQKSTRLGLKIESYCIPCRRQRLRDYYARKATAGNAPARLKWCDTCGKRKAAAQFHRDGRYSDGLLASCRSCRNRARRT